MACLSFFPEDGKVAVSCANPIYLRDPEGLQDGARLTFEVLEVDALLLKSMVGEYYLFALGAQAFWGALQSLEPSVSALFGKPTLGGTLLVRKILHEGRESLEV